MPDQETYEVTGNQKVLGVAKGDTVKLDPDDPRTRRLINAGHVKPKPAKKKSGNKKKGES